MSKVHLTAQYKLQCALAEATSAPDAAEFMTASKEATALVVLMREAETLLLSGHCPLPKLMAVCQQALRCAACAIAQDEDRKAVVADLLAKTVPQ